MSTALRLDASEIASRNAAVTRGLPNDAYVSADWFARERNELFGTGWAAIGFASDCPTPGDVTPVDFMGAPLVMTRDREGRLRVFHNVCRHRGHILVQESRTKARTLTCRYHAWCYGLDGALRGTPNIGGEGVHQIAGFERNAHGLIEARSVVWLGVVFVNLDGKAPEFKDWIAPLVARWPHIDLTRFTPGDTDAQWSIEIAANWKLAVENYLEGYHLPTIHPGLQAVSKLADHYQFIEDGLDFAGQGTRAYQPFEANGVRLPVLPEISQDRLLEGEYPALYPNLLVGVHADQAFVILIEPVAPNLSREHVRIFFVGEDAAYGERCAPVRERARAFWTNVFAEDIGPVEAMQAGRASPGFDGGALTPAMDASTRHFHGWAAGSHGRVLVRGAHEAQAKAAATAVATAHNPTQPSQKRSPQR